MNISKSLLNLMDDQDLTAIEVSRLTKVHPSSISQIINNKRDPAVPTIRMLSEGLGLRVSEFIAAGE
jgi:transcriptional regulator with XRE-family HTH domain|tara:strand:- start:2629 stop:2829 length:201 start_codon:yes stop_codon:yes gene_type:complete